MKTVKLITCNDAMKAHILQGALENEGIESILHNENFSTLYKSCVSSIAGVDILVADEDYEKAVQVLRQNQSWPGEKDTNCVPLVRLYFPCWQRRLRGTIIGNILASSVIRLLRHLLPNFNLREKTKNDWI